jgi:trimeric autotransporter adhesin
VAHAIDYYDIDSRGGALLGSWSGMGSRDSTGAGENQSWKKAGGSDAFTLSELFLDGQTSLAPGEEISLGTAYNTSFGDDPTKGIRFRYALANGQLFIGSVAYSTESGGCSLAGDFSCNGSVENADLTLLLNNWAKPSSPVPAGWIGLPQPTAPAIDNDELTALLNHWGQSVGSGSTGGTTVPEPAAAALLACGLLLGLVGFSRRARGSVQSNVNERLLMPALASRSVASTRALAALVVGMLMAAPLYAASLDRFYQFGDDAAEQPTNNMLPFSDYGVFTLDSQGTGVDGFHDLTPAADGPLYTRTDATSRPGANATEWGLRFDGTNDFVFRANGGLGSPAVGDDDATYNGSVNYTGITTRLMGGWVRPTAAAGGQRRDIVNDTAQFGIFISGDNHWGFVNGVTTVTSTTPVALNAWTHVMHETYGNTAAVLLVNGIAVAATSNDYNAGAATGNITFGASTDTMSNYFQGDLDNFSIYVAGQGAQNFGPADLATTNDYIRQQLIGIPNGDVDMNGVLDPVVDVNKFVANWHTTKVVNGVAVGDLDTRKNGDLDMDGDIDLDDAFALHQALLGMGAGGLDFSRLGAGVPEPSSFVMIIGAVIAASLGRRRPPAR